MPKAVKSTSKALVKWDEEFANLAKETSKGAKVSEGKFISTKGGRLKFQGADIPDNEMRVCVVGWIYHNAYYDPNERYDPDNSQSPLCYAFADTPPDDGDMEPLDSVPEKQCDNCAECPFNQWESSTSGGRGKACKNTVRIALIAEDDLEDLDEAEVVYLSVPVTSVKNYLKYLIDLRDKSKRPHWSVITQISCVPDPSSQFKLTFKNDDLIEDTKLFGPLKELWEKTMETIDFPYVVREPAPKKTKAKGKVAAKPAKKGKFAR